MSEAGTVTDVFTDHQWNREPHRRYRRGSLGVKHLNSMPRSLGCIIKQGSYQFSGQGSDLLNMTGLVRQQNELDGERSEGGSQVRKCVL